MWKYIAGWTAIALAFVLPLLWLQPFGHSRSLEFAMQTDVSLTAWIYSKPLALLLSDYQEQHPEINIEIRTFRSEERLYEELAAAISTHVPPHMAEVGSSFGISGLADTGELVPFDDPVSDEAVSAIAPEYGEAFRYNGQLWALPYGAVIPVLYYNENLLRLPGDRADAGASAMTWEQLTEHATRMTQDVDADGITDIWGLVADRNALSGAIAMGEAGAAESDAEYLFGVWHDLVHRHKAMPALEHHLALSNFIDGTAGMLLAPSDIRKMLEEYIGGTFGFGILPVPHMDRNGATAVRVSGFAMLRSEPHIENIVLQLAAYLLEPAAQQRLFTEASKLPILEGAAGQMLERDDDLSDREHELLRIAAGKLRLEGAETMSKPAREQLLAIQEQLEGSGEVCIPCMVQAYKTSVAEKMR